MILSLYAYALQLRKRVLTTLMLCCVFSPLQGAHDTIRISVFIHGTVGSAFCLLELQNVWNDTIYPNSRYVRMVQFFRDAQQLWLDQIIFERGLHLWDQKARKQLEEGALSPELQRFGASYIMPVYAAFKEELNKDKEDAVYYMYGHTGLLSQTYRAKAALQLYFELAEIYNDYKSRYKNVLIDIIAHSHGGNIALQLARYEGAYQRNLHVNDCILLATPIQYETAACAYSSFFNRVINIYSRGDAIQTMDRISTAHRHSYQTFSEQKLTIARVPNKLVYDVRLLVNNHEKKIGHANLWLMASIGGVVCPELEPLPFVVLIPYLVDSLDTLPPAANAHMDCNLQRGGKKVALQFTPYKAETLLAHTPNLYEKVKPYVERVRQCWNPAHDTNLPFFNVRDRTAILQAIKLGWSPTCDTAASHYYI